MALTIEKGSGSEDGGGLTSDRRLYLTEDEQSVVEHGDARAAYLLCAAGGRIPRPEAERLGLSMYDGRVVTEEQYDALEAERDAREAEVAAARERERAAAAAAAQAEREAEAKRVAEAEAQRTTEVETPAASTVTSDVGDATKSVVPDENKMATPGENKGAKASKK